MGVEQVVLVPIATPIAAPIAAQPSSGALATSTTTSSGATPSQSAPSVHDPLQSHPITVVEREPGQLSKSKKKRLRLANKKQRQRAAAAASESSEEEGPPPPGDTAQDGAENKKPVPTATSCMANRRGNRRGGGGTGGHCSYGCCSTTQACGSTQATTLRCCGRGATATHGRGSRATHGCTHASEPTASSALMMNTLIRVDWTFPNNYLLLPPPSPLLTNTTSCLGSCIAFAGWIVSRKR